MPTISKIGFCKYKVLEGGNLPETVPNDIVESKGIKFDINYSWTTNNDCNITNIQWRPIKVVLNSSNEPTISNVSLSSSANDNYFSQLNKISILINSIDIIDNEKTNKIYENTQYSIANCIKSSYTLPHSFSKNGKSLLIEFKYSYKKDNVEYYINIKCKILCPNPYEKNVVFTENGLNDLLTKIKKYPVTSIEGTVATGQQPYITVHHGNDSNSNGTKIKVGSNITFPNEKGAGEDATGTVGIEVDGTAHYARVEGISNYLTTATANSKYVTSVTWDTTNKKLTKTINSNTSDVVTAATIRTAIGLPSGNGTSGQFLKTDGNGGMSWANVDAFPTQTNNGGKFLTTNGSSVSWATPTDTKNTAGATTATANIYMIGTTTNTSQASEQTYKNASIYATTAGYFYATRVYNAVFNDYAEYRTTINLAPGHIVIDQDDGSLVCSSARLQPGAQVISDTFGHSMGETDTAKTPLAVAGRVLVYTYQPRENYHAGMAVCSAPDGTVDIMTREEIRDYPDCIVGIVSEIPQYETWGSDNVKVDGRIWIKVK